MGEADTNPTERSLTVDGFEKTRKLTWRQEKFIEAYIDNHGNATRAAIAAGYSPHVARQIGYENLAKPYISAAIETERERLRETLHITRERLLLKLVGMLDASVPDFLSVLKDPADLDRWVGLHEKRFALEHLEWSERGWSIRILGANDRLAIIDFIWEKLELGKSVDASDRLSFLERIPAMRERFSLSHTDTAIVKESIEELEARGG